MTVGLQVRDRQGRITVDITTRVTRFVQTLVLPPSGETTVSVAGVDAENFFILCNRSTTYRLGPFFRIEAGGLRYSYFGLGNITVHFYRF